jgi:hypothetical protein
VALAQVAARLAALSLTFGFSGPAAKPILGSMPSAWKIIADRRPREIEEPSVREFYLVALPQKEAAIAVLRMRHGFDDAELQPAGEAQPQELEWLDIKPGQIFRVSPVKQ